MNLAIPIPIDTTRLDGISPCEARLPDSRRLANMASWALREEAALTPKPGLVDRRGRGAHADMDLPMLLRSADALEPHFARIAQCAATTAFGVSLRAQLGVIGREAEAAMLAATGGVNTHRGAIWALGLIVAASATPIAESVAAARPRPPAPLAAAAICARAARIPRLPTVADASPSHGSAMEDRYGTRGARGEAEDAFPHIQSIALPALRAARVRYGDESLARLQALIALIATLDDTCLLYRGGAEALAFARRVARCALDCGIDTGQGRRALAELERGLLERNASPGGSADLLAAALLLDRIESFQVESLQIDSETEATDGNA